MRLERHRGNPILAPIAEHEWEARTVFNCGVIQIDGAVALLYRAQGLTSDVSRLGLAVSTDGLSFARLDRPIFIPQDDTETWGVEDPRLTWIDDEIVMLYTAWSSHGIQIAMASTRSLFSWRRRGVVIPGPDNKDAALFPGRINGRYAMFHRIPPDIWIAYSDDLVTWGDYQKIMSPRPGFWDSLKIGAGGPPLKTDRGWLVIYHGVDEKRVYRLGTALLDSSDPTRVLHRADDFVLEPEEEWELVGDVPNVVFTCGTAEVGDRYLVYYGGADTVIGVASAKKHDLISFTIGDAPT